MGALFHSDSQEYLPVACLSRNCRADPPLLPQRREFPRRFLMGSSVDRLPSRFPVGTRYVVEGHGGGQGRLRIHLRYLEFPDGRQVELPVDRPERARSRRRPSRRRHTARK
jgi:hypothetical protein